MDELGMEHQPGHGGPSLDDRPQSRPRDDGSAVRSLPAEPALVVTDERRSHGSRQDEPGAAAPEPHPPAGSRYLALRRLLVRADMTAGLITGAVVALTAGVDGWAILILSLALGLVWPLMSAAAGLYAVDDLRRWASGITEAPTLLLLSAGITWPVFFFLGASSAAQPTAGALTAGVGLALTASTARAMARTRAHRHLALRERTLIVGSGHVAQRLVRRVRQHDELGLTPIGFVDDDAHSGGAFGLPHLGRLGDLAALLRTQKIDRVMVAFSRAGHEQLLDCIRTCRDAGVPVDVIPRLFELLDGARKIDQIGGLPLLSLDTPAFSPGARAAKRALDMALAGLGLVVLSPLLALIAGLIKLESRGPILFTQERAGRAGKVFRLLKFRSMVVGADASKDSLHGVNDLSDGVMFKIHADPRVTRVGRVLRRLSLDEIPQLVNVLRGDMSLVGPRPLVLPEAQALEAGWQARRVDLRPGLTGPWQVAGRSDIPFDEMISFDYLYVSGWSLARDVEILFATVPAVLAGRGAY